MTRWVEVGEGASAASDGNEVRGGAPQSMRRLPWLRALRKSCWIGTLRALIMNPRCAAGPPCWPPPGLASSHKLSLQSPSTRLSTYHVPLLPFAAALEPSRGTSTMCS